MKVVVFESVLLELLSIISNFFRAAVYKLLYTVRIMNNVVSDIPIRDLDMFKGVSADFTLWIRRMKHNFYNALEYIDQI